MLRFAPAMRLCPTLATALSLTLLGCGSEPVVQPAAALDREALLDPTACAACHPNHYAEWSGSMHAYAADDPVFLAMNARGQRETGGALGSFCVKCHAPLAVRLGLTTDGSNLAELPQKLKGVTCFFCHSVDEVGGAHDAPLRLATDGVLRGEIADPLGDAAHASAYSPLHDRDRAASATLCGSCHDIVTPGGAHLERTFEEWQASVFAQPSKGLACGQCHMDGRDDVASSVAGSPPRRVHAHDFPGVDVALSPFARSAEQAALVQAQLDTRTLQAALCVKQVPGGAAIEVVLDNVGAGHGFPSGATQDRRAWVEVRAWAGATLVYQSGVVPDDEPVAGLADPDLWLVRDCIFDAAGKQVTTFWTTTSYESNQLPAAVTSDASDPAFYRTHVAWTYPRRPSGATTAPTTAQPDRVTMRVRMRPIDHEVLGELVATGDLDPAVAARVRTFDLASTVLEWTPATATLHYQEGADLVDCVSRGLPGGRSATPAPTHTRCGP